LNPPADARQAQEPDLALAKAEPEQFRQPLPLADVLYWAPSMDTLFDDGNRSKYNMKKGTQPELYDVRK
jgi:hypothetical protein